MDTINAYTGHREQSRNSLYVDSHSCYLETEFQESKVNVLFIAMSFMHTTGSGTEEMFSNLIEHMHLKSLSSSLLP